MSYYRGYDDDRGYSGGGYRDRYESDYRDRDRYASREVDRRGSDRYGGRDRREDDYERRRDSYDGRRERDHSSRRREDDRRGGGGHDDRRDSGYGGRKGGRDEGRGDRREGRDDRRGGRGGGGRGGGRGRGGRGGRGGGGMKRGFGGRDRGPPAKRGRSEKPDNWGKGDRHTVMQSYFLDTIPENFEEDWVCLVCPAGKRCLLVAASNITQTYSNAGEPDLKFKSCLPNGSPVHTEVMKYHDLTILDAVFCPEKKQMYIVDLLHWKHYPYYDTEAEFRFFYLPEKLKLMKSPQKVSENNEYPLVVLKNYPCTKAGIEEALKNIDYKVNGLLFIRKKSIYECTDSPDSLWLRLDQLETVLNIPVPEGISFVETTAEDNKWREELEERKKQRAAKEIEDAARAVEEKEKKEKEDEEAAAQEATTDGEYTAEGGEYAAGAEFANSGEDFNAAEGEYTTGDNVTTEENAGDSNSGESGATPGNQTEADAASAEDFNDGWAKPEEDQGSTGYYG